MSKYRFKVPDLFKGITADIAATELDRIRDKYGVLTPELVVEESREEDSVLHKYFEWDDESAANLYRIRQAGVLIRNIEVVVTNEQVEVSCRAFVNVRQEPKGKRSFVPITEATKNDTAYKDLLKQSVRDMRSFIKKYRQVAELNGVKVEMLKIINDIE